MNEDAEQGEGRNWDNGEKHNRKHKIKVNSRSKLRMIAMYRKRISSQQSQRNKLKITNKLHINIYTYVDSMQEYPQNNNQQPIGEICKSDKEFEER